MSQNPASHQRIGLLGAIWRGWVRIFWLVMAWNYRRQARAQNSHAAAVNQRIAELTDKARDADRRAADVMGETRTGGA